MTLLSPLVELFVNGAWTDITSYVRVEDGVVIKRGRPDEASGLTPSTCDMTLDNRDGRFSPRNPNGAYYGTIGRNTPVRVTCQASRRFWGEISAWPPRWEYSQSEAWTTVQAAGITRRLTQGPKSLKGPITRYVAAASNVFAYWPCEDAQGASSVATGISGGTSMLIAGTSPVRLAADSTFPTSEPLPVLNNGSLTGTPNTNAAGDTWAYFLLSVPSTGDTDDTTLFRLLESDGSARWEVRYFTASSGSLLLRCFDNAGGSLLTSASLTGVNGVPCIVAVKLDQVGADVSYGLGVYTFSTGALQFTSGTVVARPMTPIISVQVNADRAAASTVIGHILLTKTDQTTAVVAAMRGYAGETAATRFARLCAEESVTAATIGTAATSEAMGPQTAMTLMELLSQCEAADGGYLYEPQNALGLTYRTRESMYATAPDLTLAYTNLGSLEPIDDDQATRNDITVARIGGSSARYEETSGTMSTSAPPTGVGRYDVKLDLSLYTDDQCLPKASWLAHLGTLDEPRYPVIAIDVNLLPAGAVKSLALSMDIGDSVLITSPPGTWVPPSGIKALLVGLTERIYPHAWWFEMNCAQGNIWASPFVLDSATLGRLDSDTTVTSGTLTTTATTVAYTGDTWITTAANPTEFPFAIEIAGEQMNVTAAVAGSFTVTRSVNGVVKTHAAGESIHLAQRNRIVL